MLQEEEKEEEEKETALLTAVRTSGEAHAVSEETGEERKA